MEQTPAPPPPSTPQPPEQQQQQQQQQSPTSSLTPSQATVTSTAAITPTTSANLRTTTASSLPTTTVTTTASASAPSAPPPALPSFSSNPNHQTASSLPSQPTTTQSTNSQTRPPYNKPWQQHQSAPFSHYSLPPPPLPLAPHSSTTGTNSSSPALTVPPPPRGGMAIGVPAHHTAPPTTPPASFSSLNPPSYGQPFSGLGRNITDSGPASSSSQTRQPVGGMQGMGMTGSLGSSSAMRPPGMPAHQLRPVHLRPQPSPSTHSPGAQNFQSHGMLRVSSVGSPGSPSPNSTQIPQPQNQPWLSSGSQGKHPVPPTSLRPQLSSQSMLQRSHIAQQHHHPTSATSQQQQASATQQSQQSLASAPPQEQQYGQQFPQSRIQQLLPSQQQITRALGSGIQRPQSMIPSPAALTGVPGRIASVEPEESCNRILSKRSIQELVAQIDPSEKLDPEVEDILIDIADDFVESITTFGCSLAKHRKSTTLEAKDVLLHLERNWNITLPGFSGDEIKTYKKPLMSDIHRERLAMIKKSILAAEVTNSKSSAGQTGGNPKSHLAKGPTSFVGSPTPKLREPA